MKGKNVSLILDGQPLITQFAYGEKVVKHSGTYKAAGTIVGMAYTTLGDQLFVFEFDTHPGMLHIFSAEQLRPSPRGA